MSKLHTIFISTKVDIHAARMYIRQVAREIGMDLINQARVSLLSSTLAQALTMGENKSDSEKIVVEAVERPHGDSLQHGVRIAFYTHPQQNIQGLLADVRELNADDELEFHPIDDSHIQVSLVLWERNDHAGYIPSSVIFASGDPQ